MATQWVRIMASAAALTSAGLAAAQARGSDGQVREALAEAIKALKTSQELQRRCDASRAAVQALDVGGLATSAELDAAAEQFDATEAQCAQAVAAQGRLLAARQSLKRMRGEEAVVPTLTLAQAAAPAVAAAAAPVQPRGEMSPQTVEATLLRAEMRTFGASDMELSSRKTLEERALAVRYLSFLERQPDARGSYGGSAVTLSAGEEGTEAALKLSVKAPDNQVFTDGSLTLSAPLTKGSASFYGNRDALRQSLALTAAANFRLRNSLASDGNGLNLLYNIGVNARVQETTYDYFAGNGPWTAAKEKHRPWSVGVQAVGALAKQQDADIGTWQINLDRKSTWKAAQGQTRCPLPGAGSTSVLCEIGAFGPPKQAWLWSLAGEYRREFGRMGVAPKLTLGRRHEVKQDRLDLPIYFIPSLAKDGTPDYNKLRAGISYTWDRTRNTSVAAPSHDIDRRFSLFFSTPFDSFRMP
ncbi:hypothetical protein [Roseateles sp. P5_E4]